MQRGRRVRGRDGAYRRARPVPAWRLAALALAAASAAWSTTAAAGPMKSVGVAVAVVWDERPPQAHKTFLAPRGMPLEVLGRADLWCQFRDATQAVGWIACSELSNRRTVVALESSTVLASPDDSARPLFNVDRGVILEFLETTFNGGWIMVRHRDGGVGYLRDDRVWGI